MGQGKGCMGQGSKHTKTLDLDARGFTLFDNGLAFLCSGGDLHVRVPLEEVPSGEAQEDMSLD